MAILLVTAGIVRKGDLILITKRLATAMYPGFWEFPGGKVEPGEEPQDAIIRELYEELAIHVSVSALYGEFNYCYPEREIKLIVFECECIGGVLQEIAVADHRWVKAEELSAYSILPADEQLVRRLQQEARR